VARVNILKQIKSDTGWKVVAIPRKKRRLRLREACRIRTSVRPMRLDLI